MCQAPGRSLFSLRDPIDGIRSPKSFPGVELVTEYKIKQLHQDNRDCQGENKESPGKGAGHPV